MCRYCNVCNIFLLVNKRIYHILLIICTYRPNISENKNKKVNCKLNVF